MTHKEGIAGGSGHHADDGDPSLTYAGRGEASITNRKHVGHGFEESPGVLLEPVCILKRI